MAQLLQIVNHASKTHINQMEYVNAMSHSKEVTVQSIQALVIQTAINQVAVQVPHLMIV
jgi:hypothetical protein